MNKKQQKTVLLFCLGSSYVLQLVQFFWVACLLQLLCPGIEDFDWKYLVGCVDQYVSFN